MEILQIQLRADRLKWHKESEVRVGRTRGTVIRFKCCLIKFKYWRWAEIGQKDMKNCIGLKYTNKSYEQSVNLVPPIWELPSSYNFWETINWYLARKGRIQILKNSFHRKTFPIERSTAIWMINKPNRWHNRTLVFCYVATCFDYKVTS